jgi:plasmid maintenance system antidote protein VapI
MNSKVNIQAPHPAFTMAPRSFHALNQLVASTPDGQYARVVVDFLQQVNVQMQAQGMSNAELARRLGTSAAYVSRLFGGNANLSVQTMVKLAQAVGAQLQVGLAHGAGQVAPDVWQPTPETIAAMTEARQMAAARRERDGLGN